MSNSVSGIGRYDRAHVERYSTHAVLGYRLKGGSWLGEELVEGAQEWPAQFLQTAACSILGLPAECAANINVLDFETFDPPAGFFE